MARRKESRRSEQQRQRYRNMILQRIRYAGLPARQQQKKAQPVPAPEATIVWGDAKTWSVCGQSWPIAELSNEDLWRIINYLVRDVERLFVACGNTAPVDVSLALAARTWLRDRPAFRGLVQEAVRRDMTFPNDVFRYLREYVINAQGIVDTEPWRDAERAEQREALRPVLATPAYQSGTTRYRRDRVVIIPRNSPSRDTTE